MSKSLAQIRKEIDALQRQAEKLRTQEIKDVVARIKEAIATYGLSAADLGLGGRGGAGKKRVASKVAGGRKASGVKYRDEAGNTWGGRGPRPLWLRDALASGKTLEDFAA